jgi:cyclophilin family peptidyl-prolyl cis-trans isomerase
MESTMRNRLLALFALLSLSLTSVALAAAPAAKPAAKPAMVESAVALPGGPRVSLHTSMGDIVVELYPDKAPATVQNFLSYVHEGHYNGTIFYRVIDDLLIQAGGYTVDLQRKPTHPPIANEANNGLSNQRGTIAAARKLVNPASATDEFFINTVDNPRMDYISDANASSWGYAVFGKVVVGMDVVDRIRAAKTHGQGKFNDVPVAPITIERAEELAPGATK